MVSFQTGSLHPCWPFPKLILLPFSLIGLFLQTSLCIGGPAPNWLADPLPSALLDTPSLIWKHWLLPSLWRYLHPALLWNLTGQWGTRSSYRPLVLLKSPHRRWIASPPPEEIGDILTLACVPLQTLLNVFGELNLTANRRAQHWCCTPIGVSCELPADFLQLEIFCYLTPPSASHKHSDHTHMLNLWRKHPHSLD